MPDSLALQLKTAKDTAKVGVLTSISSFYYYNSQPALAQQYAQQALDLSKKLHYLQGAVKSCILLGEAFIDSQEQENANKAFRQALALSSEANYPEGKIMAIRGLATVAYHLQYKYATALKHSMSALDLATKIKHQTWLGAVHNDIGTIHFIQLNYVKAVEHYLEAHKLARATDNKKLLINTSVNIANIYSENGEYKKALSYYEEALKVRKHFRDWPAPIVIYYNIAFLHYKYENYPLALLSAQQAYQNSKKVQDRVQMAFNLNLLGLTHLEMHAPRQAIGYFFKALKTIDPIEEKECRTASYLGLSDAYQKIKEYPTALRYATMGFQLATEIGFKDQVQKGYLMLSRSYAGAGDSTKAFRYHLHYTALKDSVFNKEKNNRIALLQSNHELDKKQAQINFLSKTEQFQKAELDQRKMLQRVLVAGILLFIGFTVLLLVAYRQKRQRNLILRQQRDEILQQKQQIEQQKERLEYKSEKLTKANQEKDFLVGLVAHDLKSPLVNLQHLTNVLYDELHTLAELQQEIVPRIQKSIVGLMNTVQQILDFQKKGNQQMHLQLSLTCSAPMVQQLLEENQPVLQTKNLQVHVDLQHPDAQFHADPSYLRNVLNNLISNAIKFTPQGKQLYIRQYITEQGRLRIEVQDEGPGISPTDQRNLFIQYHKLTAQPTGGESSTGLGLAIAKRLVNEMEGDIWCESTLGNGTTFILEFYLPAATSVATLQETNIM